MAGKFQATLKNIIEFLRSREAILVVLVMALMAQLPHTAVVFHRLSTTASLWLIPGTPVNVGAGVDWMHAYVAAISIELAVLMFVVRGKILLSWLFAICSIAMNMIYYWKPEAGWLQSVPFWGALLWAAILPVAIAFYSHEIGNGENDKEKQATGKSAVRKTTATSSAISATGETSETSELPTLASQGEKSPLVASQDANTVDVPKRKKTNKPSPPKTPQVPTVPEQPTITATAKMERALQLLSEGLTYPQVAEELQVAETTVRGYVFKAKQKTPISD